MKTSGKKYRQASNSYLKYSGMAFQMMAICAVFAISGVYLDRALSWKFPLFTVLLTMLGVFLAMYSSLRDFMKKD